MALDELFSYFKAYDRDAFYVVACQGNEPSEQDVASFERACGLRLPDEFREFTMSGLGGLYMEVHEELWPRPQVYSVGPFWSFLYAVKVFGIAKDIPEWLDLRVQWPRLRDEGFLNLVPFLQREGDANRYCFTPRGDIVSGITRSPRYRRLVPVPFSDLLMQEIRDLEERARKKAAGEDQRV